MKPGPHVMRRRLGAMIREIRLKYGFTQKELAARLRQSGFSRCQRSLLSQIEAGAASIRGEEIYCLLEVFGETFEQDFWSPYHIRIMGTTKHSEGDFS